MASGLGKVHLIANPAARIGHGAVAAERATERLRAVLGEDAVVCTLTKGAGHAADLACASAEQGFGTVVALGGDGVVHEAACGLMRLSRDERPSLGLIPVGSGNDYARTLGMSERVDEAVSQLLAARSTPYDVGCVNGEYFVETLSFGLDAAIALDTVERRRRTGRTGTILYLESGINQLLFNLHSYRAEIELQNVRGTADAQKTAPLAGIEHIESNLFLMAVQIGPTYGGGFRICPEARADDGLFDVCMVDAAIGKPKGIVTFLRAKNGGHVRTKHVSFHRARSLEVRVPQGLAIQADGERIPESDVYAITCISAALDVLAAGK